MLIRITSLPAGDAPDYVRQAWVGLVLPAHHGGVQSRRTLSIYSRRRSLLAFLLARLLGKTRVQTGFVVKASDAVEILAKGSPDMAQWWRQKAPLALGRRQILVFEASACEELPDPPSRSPARTRQWERRSDNSI